MRGGARREGGVHCRGGAEGVRVGGEHGWGQGAVRGQRLVRVQVLMVGVAQAVRVGAQAEVTQAPEAEGGVAEAGAQHVHGLEHNLEKIGHSIIVKRTKKSFK